MKPQQPSCHVEQNILDNGFPEDVCGGWSWALGAGNEVSVWSFQFLATKFEHFFKDHLGL